MARIPPLDDAEADPAARAALEGIVAAHGRTTHMKRTLARSPVALDALMTWYDLRAARGPRRRPAPLSQGRAMSTASELAGQVALITGAAHGQGRATALAMAREGAHVAALDVARPLAYPGYAMGSADDLESLADE